MTALAPMEKEMGKKFGDPKNPLLVSVRSGARKSMPGMMETVLDIGLNDITNNSYFKNSDSDKNLNFSISLKYHLNSLIF